MKNKQPIVAEKRATEKIAINDSRRHFLRGLLAGSSLLALNSAAAEKKKDDTIPVAPVAPTAPFPGDPAEHKVVYQFNDADEGYHNAVLFSVGAMLRKYGDNIEIVVVGIGPGIHVLAKNPERPVSENVRARVSSLMEYGVKFHACGNTMKALNWKPDNIIDGVAIVEVGAADLMELQEKGYAYLAW